MPRRSGWFLAIAWCQTLGSAGLDDQESAMTQLLTDDEQCDFVGSCALSALQVDSRKLAVASSSGVKARQSLIVYHHPGVALHSEFFTGSGPSPSASCAAQALNQSSYRAAVASAFGAGGGGAMWRAKSLVIADSPDKSKVDLEQPVRLELTVTSRSHSWDVPATIWVSGLAEMVPNAVKFKTKAAGECPPAYCLMHEPTSAETHGSSANTPPCGWAPESSRASAPAPGGSATTSSKVSVDVSELVKAGFTVFKVWVGPQSLRQSGMWQTSQYKITSWGFSWVPASEAS